jgi:hypothetical protein
VDTNKTPEIEAYEAKIKELQAALVFKDATILNLKTGNKNYSGDLALLRELELRNKIIKGECVDWAETAGLLEKLGVPLYDAAGYHKTIAEGIQELYDKMAAQINTMRSTIIRCKKDMSTYSASTEFPGPYKVARVGNMFEAQDKHGCTIFKSSCETMLQLAVDCMNIVFASI